MKKHNPRFLLQKLLNSLLAIFFIATITFFLFEWMPGDIYSIDNIKNPNVIQNIVEKYELNAPVGMRYKKMILNLLRLDFGNSFLSGEPVREIIWNHFPISLQIGCTALLLALVNGIIVGSIISLSRNQFIKKAFWGCIIICYSLPTFEIAALSQYIFCVRLRWFPVICSSDFQNMLLPIILLSFAPMTFIARLLYRRLRQEDTKDYVLAARLRGVHGAVVFFFYQLKNSVSAIITTFGSLFASMVVGSFTIEVIFSIPGLGKFFITSITNRDYPLVMGLTMFYAIFVILTNYLAEVAVELNDWGKCSEDKA